MSAGARDFCKDIVPAPTDARRGCAPPGASRQTWLLAPPHEWAYPAHTRGAFRFTTKGTKGVPGAVPLDPLRGTLRSPCSTLCCYPLKRACATDPDGFAT